MWKRDERLVDTGTTLDPDVEVGKWLLARMIRSSATIDVFLYGVGHGYSSFLLDELNECLIHELESCSK